jgi:hypothetical protein
MEFTVTSTDVGVVALWAMEDLEEGAQCSMSENLEEAGTWYYVVDCATCKAPVPFKHAPEGEPIVCFPTMTVRCFQCHTHQTYAPDLISRRKAAPPRGIFNGDRQPSRVNDGNREAARDRQEDRDERDLGVRVLSDRKIAPISASLRCNNILNVAVRGKRATIFFFSSCFFAAGWVSNVALNIFSAAPVAALNEVRSSGPAMLLGTLGTAFFGIVLLGLVLFVFGMGSVLVEAFGFKRRLIKRGFARIDFRIASLAVHAASTVAVFLIEMWQRKFPTRELPGALAGRAWQGRAARTKTSGAKQDF